MLVVCLCLVHRRAFSPFVPPCLIPRSAAAYTPLGTVAISLAELLRMQVRSSYRACVGTPSVSCCVLIARWCLAFWYPLQLLVCPTVPCVCPLQLDIYSLSPGCEHTILYLNQLILFCVSCSGAVQAGPARVRARPGGLLPEQPLGCAISAAPSRCWCSILLVTVLRSDPFVIRCAVPSSIFASYAGLGWSMCSHAGRVPAAQPLRPGPFLFLFFDKGRDCVVVWICVAAPRPRGLTASSCDGSVPPLPRCFQARPALLRYALHENARLH